MQWCSDTVQIIAIIGGLLNICACSGVSGGQVELGGSGSSGGSYYADSVYRNLDTQLLRIGSRLDQLMIRMDHLDSRVGRVQSTGHLRFDSIETSMQTTRQRLDLWSNQLNLIEEQLTRKWKNMESRFDSLVSTMDSKLDTKFNLIQRDNRRHNEFISQSFNSVIISQEKLSDRVGSSIHELNTTLQSTNSAINTSTSNSKSHSSTCVARLDDFLKNLSSSTPQQPQQRRNTIQPTDQLAFQRLPMYSSYPTSHHPVTQNSTTLISTKVSNMFDDLVKRSHDLEAIVKDTFTMSNMTRREVQDGFMALIPIVSQVGFGREKQSGGASGEVMSMVVEALSTVEQTSTSLGRRMAEMNRSINERFEMVSMSLNGFLESCLRIQEKTPQMEDRIVEILLRIVESVDISTRNATETWQKVKQNILLRNNPNCTIIPYQQNSTELEQPEGNDTAWDYLLRAYENLQQQNNEDNEYVTNQQPTHQHGVIEEHEPRNEDVGGRSLGGLSEDQKKMIWESLSRLGGSGGEEEYVPE